MSQRVRVDRQSFEQFLAAICFLQQLRQEATRRIPETAQPLDDVYVPGIGVRAALGGDDSEPSKVWPVVRKKGELLAQSACHLLYGLSGCLHAPPALLAARQSARLHLRRIARYQPKPLPVRRWVEELHSSLASSSLPNFKSVRKEPCSGLGYRFDLNGLRRDGAVWAVLFVILLFLVLEMGMHNSARYAPVTSINAAQASTVPSKAAVAGNATSPKPQAGLHKLRQAGKVTAGSARRHRKPSRPASSSE